MNVGIKNNELKSFLTTITEEQIKKLNKKFE